MHTHSTVSNDNTLDKIRYGHRLTYYGGSWIYEDLACGRATTQHHDAPQPNKNVYKYVTQLGNIDLFCESFMGE